MEDFILIIAKVAAFCTPFIFVYLFWTISKSISLEIIGFRLELERQMLQLKKIDGNCEYRHLEIVHLHKKSMEDLKKSLGKPEEHHVIKRL